MVSLIQAISSSEWNYSLWMWSLKRALARTGLRPGTAQEKNVVNSS